MQHTHKHIRSITAAMALAVGLTITTARADAPQAPKPETASAASVEPLLAAQGLVPSDLDGRFDVTSAALALRALKIGNARYYSERFVLPDLSSQRRRAQAAGQNPFAVVLGCADSRVSPEIVFDQGIGDIFTVRVAGNVADPGTLGSIEYAVEHLKPQILVVMGHQACGAVRGVLAKGDPHGHTPRNVAGILDRIRPAAAMSPVLGDASAREYQTILNNVRLQVAILRHNEVVAKAFEEGKLWIVGAYYDMDTGAVTFLESDGNVRPGFTWPLTAAQAPQTHSAPPVYLHGAAGNAAKPAAKPPVRKPAKPAEHAHGH